MTKFAVIGIAVKLPGSNSTEQFFQNLLQGKDCVSEVPASRWDKEYYFDEDKSRAGKIVTRRGGFIEGIYDFDNEAFNMSAKEATNIDPQQRILLEVTHQALEDANISFRGSNTGVFIGSGASDFTQLATSNPFYVSEYTAPGGALSIHANRISYAFDLRGPSFAIDTACSASGSAMFVATKCLQDGDCEQAVVGGINILMNQSMTVAFSKLGVLSTEGKSKSFDAEANGYVRSEGCGVVVIKPLDKAIRDGNHIYCVIRSISANEDGAQSPSLTMPSGEAQHQLIKKTLAKSGVHPHEIFFVEAHATGTLVGDPIELNTLGKVYGEGRNAENKLRVGSVKTNIGHMEFASYMASLIKCCLMMDRQILLPSIHFKKPNPKIDFERYNMVVQTECEKFDRHGKFFSISSFGFGGANICTILEAPPSVENTTGWKLSNPPNVYLVSGLTKAAVQEKVKLLKELKVEDEHQLVFNLNSQKHDQSRLISIGMGATAASAKFSEPLKIAQRKEPVVFVFSGQGPQTISMGRELYKSFPKFREIIDRCDALYKAGAGFSVVEDIGLFGPKVGEKNVVNDIKITLPGLIFIQIGLFELWKSFGLVPDAIIGHSFGEMCAIYASGACTLEEIISVTIKRAQLMTHLKSSGTMIALGCSEAEYKKIIEETNLDNIWIAAVNSPQSVTAGGSIESVKALSEVCTQRKIFNRVLNVTNAYHTPYMSPLKEAAHQSFKGVIEKTSLPQIPVISTVTGEFWNQPFDAGYFWLNIENAVLFQAAIEKALHRFGSEAIFLEMAPHPVLSMSMKQIGVTNMLYSQHREENQQQTLLNAVAKLHVLGYSLNWCNIVGSAAKLPSLPTYPFQRKTFFHENEMYRELRLPSSWGSMVGSKTIHHLPTYQNFVSTKSYDWLADHVVQDAIVFPAAGYVEMALEALGTNLEKVEIKNPMTVPSDNAFQLMQTSIKQTEAASSLEIHSKSEGSTSWTVHAVASKGKQPKNLPQDVKDLNEIIARCESCLDKENCYKRFEVMRLSYGPSFQCVEKLYQGDEESLGVLSAHHLRDLEKFILHPAVLDCCFQCFLGTMKSSAATYLPTGLDAVHIYESSKSKRFFVHCTCETITEKSIKGNIKAFDETGKVLFEVKGFSCTLIPKHKPMHNAYYHTVWQSKRLPDVSVKQLSEISASKFEAERNVWGSVISHMPVVKAALATYISKQRKDLFDAPNLSVSQQRHLNWCKSFLEQNSANVSEESLKQLSEIAGFELEAQTIHRVGANFEDLALNKENAVSRIMFGDDLIQKIYAKAITFKPAVDMVVEFMKNLSVGESRTIRILEVGSGTGTLARELLPILQKWNGRVEYFFTDVSAAFFAPEKRFKEYTFVQYKVVDIEKPLDAQGIADESIDIVIGFDVVHTAQNLASSVQSIQKVLVPDGLLMLIEPTVLHAYMHFIFGVFREWWHFDDGRQFCCQDVAQWQKLLPALGYKDVSSLELSNDHVHSIIVARKVAAQLQQTKPAAPALVHRDGNIVTLLNMVQEKMKKNDEEHPTVIIVTKGAQIECKHPESAPVIGFGRVLANECPKWQVRIVDFAPDATEEEQQKWISLIESNPDKFETEVAVRDGEVLVTRTICEQPAKASVLVKEQRTPFRLEIPQDGLLDNMKYQKVNYDMENIPEGRVLIAVKAAPLNFRDVLLAMKMLEYSAYLGLEFAGIVEKVGPNVSKFKVGDAVYGVAENCLGSHVIANADLIVHKPSNLTFDEASTIPIVFLTVYYALFHKTNVNPGDKVLVHSAAGGVGQAAIQLLKWRGADIYATVGTEGKRKLLQEKYGVVKFADSHSLEWDSQVRQLTPDGVDFVLNSLAGIHITKGLNVLAPCGSFIEIGKRDIMDNTHVGLAPFIKNLSYYSVHLDFLIDSQPKLIGRLLEKISDLFSKGILSTFVDKSFPAKNVVDAFRYMQTGKHAGKIVVNFDTENYPIEVTQQNTVLSPNKTYVLSGGLGAVGFEVAKWMITQQGARNVVLMSRAGKLSKYHQRQIEHFKSAYGATVVISKTDAQSKKEVESMYRDIVQVHRMPPVAGVIHLAMVLDDAGIPKMTPERIEKVARPKVDGAKNLVEPLLQEGNKLDFVILFSSISSVVGNPDQSNYAAANAFLDAYARSLNNKGLNAKVINLGAVDDVGVIATDFVLRKIMLARGLDTTILASQVCEHLRRMISGEVKTVQLITQLDFKEICEYNPAMYDKFSHLVAHKQDEDLSSLALDSCDSGLAITRQIEKLLQLDEGAIEENEKLTTYGVDSLLAVEISSMLSKLFQLKVSQMDILSGITLKQIIAKFEQKK